MSAYTFRKQWLTGKLILQYDGRDSPGEMRGRYELVPVSSYTDLLAKVEVMRERIAKFDRRSAGQRKANLARKAAAE